jgi:hypothetical protein
MAKGTGTTRVRAGHGWAQPLLGPMELTEADKARFRELATQLLDQTLREYDEHAVSGGGGGSTGASDASGAASGVVHMDPRRWKVYKSQPNFTMYYERGGLSARSSDSSFADNLSSSSASVSTSSSHSSTDSGSTAASSTAAIAATHVSARVTGDATYAKPTVIVGAGMIDAPMDDILYGDGALDVRDMRLKASLVNNHLSEGAVLAQIVGPTAEEPFRFLGLRWVVGEPIPLLRRLVRARDFLYLASSGTLLRANGDFVGYELIQSVDMPQFPDMERAHGITRGKTAAGVILRQRPDGATDIFVRSFVEKNGRIVNAILLAHTWSTYMGFFSTPTCAFAKKLAWCAQSMESIIKRRRQQFQTLNVTATSCARCLRPLNRGHDALLHSRNTCLRCGAPLCTDCRTTHQLRNVDTEMQVHDQIVVLCSPCVAFVHQLNAAEVARQEIRGGRYGPGLMADATLQSKLLARIGMRREVREDREGEHTAVLGAATSAAAAPADSAAEAAGAMGAMSIESFSSVGILDIDMLGPGPRWRD